MDRRDASVTRSMLQGDVESLRSLHGCAEVPHDVAWRVRGQGQSCRGCTYHFSMCADSVSQRVADLLSRTQSPYTGEYDHIDRENATRFASFCASGVLKHTSGEIPPDTVKPHTDMYRSDVRRVETISRNVSDEPRGSTDEAEHTRHTNCSRSGPRAAPRSPLAVSGLWAQLTRDRPTTLEPRRRSWIDVPVCLVRMWCT